MNQNTSVIKKMFKSPLFWVNAVIIGPFIATYAKLSFGNNEGLEWLGILLALPLVLVLIIIDCIYLVSNRNNSPSSADQRKASATSLVKLAILTFIMGGSALLLMAIIWTFMKFQAG